MQGKISLERLLSISGGMKLGKKLTKEIEECLQNLQPKDIEDFKKICSYEKEIKELEETMIGKTDYIELKSTVTKLICAAKLKEIIRDEEKDSNERKKEADQEIKAHVERIQSIIKMREKSAQRAALLVTERYINKKAKEFVLPPKTVSQLRNQLLIGLGCVAGGVLAWILGAFGAYSEGSLIINTGIRLAISTLSFWPTAFFLGGTALLYIGIRKLMEHRKDKKYAKDFEKFQTYLNFCAEMVRIRDEKLEQEKLEREKLEKEKPQVNLEKEKPLVLFEKVYQGCTCSLRKY